MVAVSSSLFAKRGDGKDVMKVTLVANTTPSPLPTTGEGIDGMTADQVFAVYIANEDGVFVAQ